MPAAVLNVGYLLVSVLFILALKGMAHPQTAVRGNLLGASGMLLAISSFADTTMSQSEWTSGWQPR